MRNLPAALYKAMGGFATNGVNMTKLESYMVDGNFFATQFYADVDGHPDDKNLAFALEELKFFSREFRIVEQYVDFFLLHLVPVVAVGPAESTGKPRVTY